MTDNGDGKTFQKEGRGQRTGRRLSIFKAFFLVALVVITGYGMLNRGLYFEELWIPVVALILGLVFVSLFVGGFYRDVPRVGWVLVGLMAVLVAVKGLSLTWTISPPETVRELLRSSMYLATFVVALATATSRRLIGPFIDGMNLIVLAVAGYGVLQKINPVEFDPRARDGVRIGSTLEYSNTVAVVLGMGIVLGLARMTQLRQPVYRGLYAVALLTSSIALYFTFSRGGILALVLALVGLFVLSGNRLQMFANLLLVSGPLAWLVWRAQDLENLFARNIPAEQRLADGAALRTDLIIALIAAFLLQAVYAALVERYDLVPTVRRVLGVAAVVAVLVGFGALAYAVVDEQLESGGIKSAFTQGMGGKKDQEDVSERLTSLSSNSRSAYWSVAWEEWKEHPLTGTGAGTFHYTWLENRPGDSSVRQVHNVYLEQGTETGVFAFLALSGFAALLGLYLAWSTWKASGDRRLLLAGLTAAAGLYLVHSALEWHWYIPPSTLFFFILAGVAIRFAFREDRDVRKQTGEYGGEASKVPAESG
jgi:O-antigen ligase